MKKSTPRGRPKKYDPDVALQNALALFWKKGYAATSLDNLAEATGMNRPSLYAAFGNKQSIYLKSMKKFQSDLEEKIGHVFEGDESIATALQNYFHFMIDIYTGSLEEQHGCLTLSTAAVEAPNDENIREHLAQSLKLIDKGFRHLLRKAIKRGELPTDTDPEALASLFGAVQHSLSIRARAGADKNVLKQLVKQAIQNILPLE